MIDWNCPVCGQPNAADARACVQCGCRADASDEDAQFRRSTYAGPAFESAGVPQPSRPHAPPAFSPGWWSAPLHYPEAIATVAAVGAGAGAMTVVLGTVGTGWTVSAVDVFLGAVIMAPVCAMGYLRLYMWATRPGTPGTRRDVVVFSAIALVAALALGMLRRV
jgi:hypothetical protein